MKTKILHFFPFALVLTLFLLAGCSKKPYEPEEPEEPPKEEIMLPRVEGRVALAYVTYYGTQIPDASVLTHINYAFAELYVRDSVYKGFKLQGKESRFASVVKLKQKYPHLKICLSFSHTVGNPDNKQGGGFSALAKSEEQRIAFAEDCKAFCRSWGIDGIDIDWEFPGLSWSGHACDVAVDVENHVLLMKQLRETLGDEYLLTYAGYCKDKRPVTGGWRYIDVAAVDPYVDFVNIMTYDMDAAPHHHSALNDPSTFADCRRAVQAYLDAGVPASKLVLGIPFYGRHAWGGTGASIPYKRIILLQSPYKIDNWDATASCPYVTNGTKFHCGYDNARSIAIKGEWLLKKGMKGMMCWEYEGDDAKGTLRKAVWNAVMKR